MYDTALCQGQAINPVMYRPSISQSLSERKTRLEQELAEVNEALRALEANPELGKILETLNRATRF